MAEKWDLQLRICRDLQQLVMPMDFMLPSWSVGVSEKTGRRLEIRFLIPYRARQGMPGGGHSDLDPVAREGGTIGPALEHWTLKKCGTSGSFFFCFQMLQALHHAMMMPKPWFLQDVPSKKACPYLLQVSVSSGHPLVCSTTSKTLIECV